MLFPFFPPRAATFHMGSVAFPIDLVFADGRGRVARIVHAAQPGTRGVWSHPIVGAVVEVPGGFCARTGLGIGELVTVAGHRLSAQTYNILQNLDEAATEDVFVGTDLGTSPALGGGSLSSLGPDERFQHSTLPDEDPDAMSQPNSHFQQTLMPSLNEDAQFPVRAQVVDVDLTQFVPALIEGSARAGLAWEPTVLNPVRDQAVVTAQEVGRWIHALGLPEQQRSAVHQVATSKDGLDAIGAGFIAAGMADTANLTQLAHQNALVLTRSKQHGSLG